MIKATAVNDRVELYLLPDERFAEELAVVRAIPPRDRRWRPDLKLWIISNPGAYRHIKAIDTALREKDAQLKLFERC